MRRVHVALFFAAIFAASAAMADTSGAPSAPPGLNGKLWSYARTRLIQLGYQPVRIAKYVDDITCEREEEHCKAYPELVSCTGAGTPYCRYLYRHPKTGKLFQVVTTGEWPDERFEGFGQFAP